MDDLDFAMLDPGPVEAAETLPPPPRFADLPDGIHAVPDEVYHQRELGVASASSLKRLARSPAHYRAWALGEDEEAPNAAAQAFGRAFHAAVLEPQVFREHYAALPSFGDGRTKAARLSKAAWLADNRGKSPLPQADFDRIVAMQEALDAHPLVSRILRARGLPEIALLWTDPTTQVRCKAKADLWVPDLRTIFDLKTTEDASHGGFVRSIAKWTYHVQAAFYRGGFRALGHEVEHFVFIAVEKAPPFNVALYELAEDVIGRGEDAIRAYLLTLRQCIDSDTWPGYAGGIQTIDNLPGWAA